MNAPFKSEIQTATHHEFEADAHGQVDGERLARRAIRKPDAHLQIRDEAMMPQVSCGISIGQEVQLIERTEVADTAVVFVSEAFGGGSIDRGIKIRHPRNIAHRSGITESRLHCHPRVERKACHEASSKIRFAEKFGIGIVQTERRSHAASQFEAIFFLILCHQGQDEKKSRQYVTKA